MIRTIRHHLLAPIEAPRTILSRRCRQSALVAGITVLLITSIAHLVAPSPRVLIWTGVSAIALVAALQVPLKTQMHLAAFAAVFAVPWVTLPVGVLRPEATQVQLIGLLVCLLTVLGASLTYRRQVVPVAVHAGLVSLGLVAFSVLQGRLEIWATTLFGLGLASYVFYCTRYLFAPVDQTPGDPVSGLANRKEFFEAFRQRLDGTPRALLVFELAGLDRVNDQHGRQAGDALLALIGQRIARVLHGHGLAARLDGDEFAIILDGCNEAGCKLALDVAAALSQPALLNDKKVYVRAAIGVALHPAHGDSAAGLMRKATTAYRRALTEGESAVALYDPSLDDALADLDPIGEALEAMISSGGPDVVYQPKIDLSTGALVGAEALIRWTHPTMGPISPERFLAIAADRALIHPLTEQVFDRVARDISRWSKQGTHFGRIALNIHPVDLADPDHLMNLIEGLLVRDVGPDEILLEITEGCFVGNGRVVAPDVLGEIAGMGFPLSLDDFGTGYAALTHLQSLPVSEVKIDKAFIANIVTETGDRAIVEALVSMAQACGLKTVAEGVETAEQAVALRDIGATVGQGHYWSGPVSAAQYASIAGELQVA